MNIREDGKEKVKTLSMKLIVGNEKGVTTGVRLESQAFRCCDFVILRGQQPLWDGGSCISK